MASFMDHFNALPEVTYQGKESGEHREKVARMLAGSGVQPAHYAGVRGIHGGSMEQTKGNAGLYLPGSRDLFVAGNFHPAYARTLVHEIGHGMQHQLSGSQFGQMLRTPRGHARVEADAENYADRMLPGSYSRYDHFVNQGKVSFDPNYYKDARGKRFGNIDPRVR